jgi:hypothetical protein
MDIQLSRYHGLLHFVATRVLGGDEGADEAVKNYLRTSPLDFGICPNLVCRDLMLPFRPLVI